jgi:hypothetical protein
LFFPLDRAGALRRVHHDEFVIWHADAGKKEMKNVTPVKCQIQKMATLPTGIANVLR